MALLALIALLFERLGNGEASPSSACEALDNGPACGETGTGEETSLFDEASLLQRTFLQNEHLTLLGECEYTSFTLTLDGYSHIYELEKTTGGQELSLPCNHGPYTSGNVTFKCINNEFDADWSSCREPDAEGYCVKTNVQYTFAGYGHVYNLPRLVDGATETQQCAMGPYTVGQVVFKCAKGRLSVPKQNCSKPGTAISCRKKKIEYSIDDHPIVYTLGEMANGETRSHKCKAGPYTLGDVIFTCENGEFIVSNTCMTEEQWEKKKSLGPGYCDEVLFTMSLNDDAGNHSHTYKLDMMKNGGEATPQCAMGDYTAGEVEFKCEDGKIKAMNHSCSKPVQEWSCGGTNFQYTIFGHSYVYKLPGMVDGATVTRPCAMGPYTEGKIMFKCDRGNLSVAEQTCAHPIPEAKQQVCEEVSAPVSLGGYSHTYVLDKTSNGGEVSQACSFGPFNLGNMVFKCKVNQFVAEGHSCRPAPGVCGKRDVKYKFNGHSHVYSLEWMANEAIATHPCAMGPYTVGEVVFKCNKGRLLVAKETCAKPPASMSCAETEIEHTVDHFFTNTYKLKHSAHGQKDSHPCPAESDTVGEIIFTCENGKFIISDQCKFQGKE